MSSTVSLLRGRRTRDLARFCLDGTLEYCGRADGFAKAGIDIISCTHFWVLGSRCKCVGCELIGGILLVGMIWFFFGFMCSFVLWLVSMFEGNERSCRCSRSKLKHPKTSWIWMRWWDGWLDLCVFLIKRNDLTISSTSRVAHILKFTVLSMYHKSLLFKVYSFSKAFQFIHVPEPS